LVSGLESVDRELLAKRLVKGPPDELRWTAWKSVLELDRYYDAISYKRISPSD
jgi:hypothetical protein